MTIYGKEIDFKISNLKNAGDLELALKKMGETEGKINKSKDGSLAKLLTEMLCMFRDFFTNATGVDVLQDCQDLHEAKQAYFSFLKEIEKQKEEILKPYDLSRVV